MKILVLFDNKIIQEMDFSKEISPSNDSRSIFLVGRSKNCHVVLDNIKVSREYAEIIFEKQSWSIKAKNSETFLNINGLNLKEKKLEPMDVITIGGFTLKVELADGDRENTKTLVAPPDSGAKETAKEKVEDSKEGQEQSSEEDGERVEEENQEEEGEKNQEEGEVEESEEGEAENQEQGDGEEAQEEFYGEQDDSFQEDEFAEDNSGENQGEDSGGEESGDETQVDLDIASHFLDIFGEYAPYDSYAIKQSEVFIGRDGEKCQIILNDPEVSSVHAVVRKTGSLVVLEDLQSGNGTLLGGKRVNTVQLGNGDEFIIGSTTLTYRVESDFLKQEKERLMPVEENQSIEVEEIVEVDEDFEETGDEAGFSEKSQSLFSKDTLKDPEKRKKILMIGAGLLALWVFMEEEPPNPEVAQTAKEAEKNAKEEVKKDAKGGETATPTAEAAPSVDEGPKLSTEERGFLEQQYLLANENFSEGKFQETIFELEKIFLITKNWKQARQIEALAKEGLARIEEQERKRKEEEERRKRDLKVKEFLGKARKAVEERKERTAEFLFAEILKLEPDNFDVPQLKLELEAWKKEEAKRKFEEARKLALRKKKVNQLKPGKSDFLGKKWYSAILKLENFMRIEDMDEDLTKEASVMLETSRVELKNLVDPLLNKARSLKRGQDLKGAYEHYSNTLLHDPGNEEALNEISRISIVLERRSRGIYIEGLISEDLGLFKDAKEKFQEVQQVSPSDGKYYKRASNKLEDYFD